MRVSGTVLRQRLEHALGVQKQRPATLGQPGGRESPKDQTEPDANTLLAMLLEGLDEDHVPSVPEDAVGYGSLVVVRDLDTGENTAYRIMSGAALDLDAGHISLDSALGSALLGMSVGTEVEVRTPAGPRHIGIAELQTVHSFLDEITEEMEDVGPTHEPDPSNLEEVGP